MKVLFQRQKINKNHQLIIIIIIIIIIVIIIIMNNNPKENKYNNLKLIFTYTQKLTLNEIKYAD